jgi:parallel beta-helix repeat protein
MKPVICSLFLVLLLTSLLTTPAAATAPPNIITLTADQVAGANDIEAAIISATAEGTRPGTVILDGRNGPFIYTGDDRSLNLFVSGLTLRGVNGATIQNCDDGLFFDDFPLKYILVEGIAFYCGGDGVAAGGAFRNITLRNNTFQTGGFGISLGGSSHNWLIANNTISAGADGIRISDAKGIVILSNKVSGYLGIVVMRSSDFQVRYNTIQAVWQGVLLGQESWMNTVKLNTIRGVIQSGVSLEPDVTANKILYNKVSCAPDSDCLTVDVPPEVADLNIVYGNVP